MQEHVYGLLRDDYNLRNLVIQSPFAMALLRGENHIIELVNDKCNELVGADWDYLKDKPVFEALPELLPQGFEAVFMEVMLTGAPFSASEQPVLLNRQGASETVFVSYTLQALKDADGNVLGIFFIGTDVSEQVTSRKKIVESEKKYRSLFHSMNQGFCIIEVVFDEHNKPVDYIYLEVNPAFEELTNLKDVIGKGARELIPGHEEHWFDIYGSVAQNREEIKTVAKAAILHRWYEIFAFPIGAEDGNLVAVLFSDITDFKKKEAARDAFARELKLQVEERTRELRNSNNDLQQFAHVVSHDLKEPVRKVLNFSNMLLNGARHDPETANLFARKINRSTRRLSVIIDDILKYSASDHSMDEIVTIDLNDIICAVRNDLELSIREKQASFRVDHMPVIEGYSILIYQLFFNLISNSLKFSRPGVAPIIIIKAGSHMHDNREFVRITVADNGVGFENKYADNIFQTFTRLNSRDKYDGTGLGLALCRKNVVRHSGTIQASGRLYEGATFTITLPVKFKDKA